MSKSSASNLLKNFCYVEYLYVAAFLSNILCTIFQSMCANLICVQIWLQIAPDQWPRRGHSGRSPAALELHSLERDKVLTSCITVLMRDQTLPCGPKWVKGEVFNFRRTVVHFLRANYPETCHLNRMRPHAYWQNKGLEWLWWYPTLTVWFESCSRTCSWTKCAKNVCWSRQSAHSGVRGRHIFLRPTYWRAVRCREAASQTRLLLPRAIPGSACQLGFPILRQFHFREQTWVADFTYGYRVVREFLFKSWDFWEPTKIGVL